MLIVLKDMHTHKGVLMKVLKQIFANLFDRKNGKLGFNVEFVSGFLNHNAMNNFEKNKCSLNFENQKFIIKQGSQEYSDSMQNVYNFVKIKNGNNYFFHINTKTHDEFTFNFGEYDLMFQALKNYADAFEIPFEIEEGAEE